ncbi:MAG: ABC transporter permease [Oscillospiraceae bacterium]|nr:ABC-2 transporter permease [Bacteroidales bacterium]MDY5096093.1 ABC transporter permease [Oscillospiraceae bacterium]
MIAIYKRDLKGFFTGMMGYVLLAFFLAVGGLYFTVMNLMSGYPDLSYTLYNNLFVLLLLVPLLTMRSFAEERRARTDQLLLTSPVPLWRIVLGKYLAVLSVFGMAVLVFALYPLIMSRGGAVSYRQSYAALLAFFLLGAACIAIGVFLSSLNENQIVAAVCSFFVLLLAYLMPSIQTLFTVGSALAMGVFLVLAVLGAAYAGWHSRSWGLGLGVFTVCCAAILVLFWLRSAALTSAFSSLLGALCLFSPFEKFVSGLFSLSAVVYYLSVTALFLFFTCQTLEKRRWN